MYVDSVPGEDAPNGVVAKVEQTLPGSGFTQLRLQSLHFHQCSISTVQQTQGNRHYGMRKDQRHCFP